VLLELLTLPAGGAAPFALLLGVGLNLGPDPRDIDPGRAGTAGPIEGFRSADPRPAVAAGLLNALEGLVRSCGDEVGWRVVLESVRAISRAAQGHPVTVRDPDGRLIAGSGVGIREDGALLVEQSDGTLAIVRYGERVYTDR
jgi:biotin-(acetyl-CoA carboxylase) ligase